MSLARIASLLIALLPIAACSRVASSPATRDASALAVRRADFVQRLVLTGELEAIRADNIAVPPMPEWQANIRWMEADGAEVVAGQKVLELDASTIASKLDEKRLGVLKAESDLEQKTAESARSIAEKKFQLERRRVDLDKARLDAGVPQELVSRQKLDELQLALRRAMTENAKAEEDLASTTTVTQAAIQQAQIALESARQALVASQRALDDMVLRAPRNGILVVGEQPWEGRKFEIGDTVWQGLSVLQIPDLSKMRVDADLSDVDDGKIDVGMRTVCELDMYPGSSFAGRVAGITPIAQAPGYQSQRRYFRVIVDLDSSDPERMRPGMSVKIVIETARIANTLLAPRSALDQSVSPPRLRLREGGEANVQLGPCNSFDCVVQSGVSEGARLR